MRFKHIRKHIKGKRDKRESIGGTNGRYFKLNAVCREPYSRVMLGLRRMRDISATAESALTDGLYDWSKGTQNMCHHLPDVADLAPVVRNIEVLHVMAVQQNTSRCWVVEAQKKLMMTSCEPQNPHVSRRSCVIADI